MGETSLSTLTHVLESDVKAIFPPKYLAYYPVAYPDLVADAQEYILDIMREEGPFDGVIGFSQGAALAASLILEHRKTSPLAPDLFRFAILICATLPFNRDDKLGLVAWKEAKMGHGVDGEFAGEVELESPPGFPKDLDGVCLGRYHPSKTPEAILELPTVHLIGKADPYAQQGRILTTMCRNTQTTMVVEHEEGHRVPRDSKAINEIAKAIDTVVHRITCTAGA